MEVLMSRLLVITSLALALAGCNNAPTSSAEVRPFTLLDGLGDAGTCVVGQTVCNLDHTFLYECQELTDSLHHKVTRWVQGATCTPGACVTSMDSSGYHDFCGECFPGSSECDGSTLYRCTDAGKLYIAGTCGSGGTDGQCECGGRPPHCHICQ
jgi:hypothetical protein